MNVKSNKFDLSHEVKLSGIAGRLYPILNMDVLPGDNIRLNTEVFVRAAPLVAPLMHRVTVRTYFFYVPYRIIWNDAEEFFTRKKDNTSTITVPRIGITNTNKGSFLERELSDYLGVPPTDGVTVSGTHYISALPFRAYQEIYNEYFRPLELLDEIAYNKTSADSDATDVSYISQIRQRNWDGDYFTKGKSQLLYRADINGVVPIVSPSQASIYKQVSNIYTSAGANTLVNTLVGTASGIGQNMQVNLTGAGTGGSATGGRVENIMTDAGIDIDDLRRISSMQRWIEALINTGSRYIDYLSALWGVKGRDSRFQRPEYLGGSQQPLRISEVLNTSDTATAAQGQMSGHGVSAGNTKYVNFKADEHGILMGLACIIPKTAYYQGMPNFLTKFDHLQFANPLLANLGRQAVPNGEIYYSYTDGVNATNFNFVERYSEYKSIPDRVCGNFRSSLAFWHYARYFGSRPAWNAQFVQCIPKTTVFAVQTGDHYFFQVFHNISALRKLPYIAVPKID